MLHRDAEDLDPDRAPAGREGAGVTPEAARHETLAAAVAAAAAVSDEWFVVPPHTDDHPTVVLPIAARRPFLQQLKDADLPAYVSVHEPEHKGWPSRRGLPADVLPALRRGRTGRLFLEPWPRVGDGASHLGTGCAVAVEFWEEGPDGDLHSPGQAAYTTAVPRGAETVDTRVHGVDVRTLPLMVEPTAYECTFPIDVVYTWVDGNDEEWNAARERRLADVSDATMRTRASSGQARFVDRGELRYSMRSVHLLAPWVRRIHLVTAGQVPPWLDVDDPMINLVDHRDLLPADALPTFNSHAIESVVHRIPGLSEHFLYFNDDFFLGRPTRPERFFTGAGSTRGLPVVDAGRAAGPGRAPLREGRRQQPASAARGVRQVHRPHAAARAVRPPGVGALHDRDAVRNRGGRDDPVAVPLGRRTSRCCRRWASTTA